MTRYTAQFEEKTFEHYFNTELRIVGARFWPPGQYVEGRVGFDGAAFTDDLHIRSLFSWADLSGLILDENMFKNVTDAMLPKFRFNFFWQHKRPEYYEAGRKTKEWKSWNSNFFSFDIDDEQQEILFNLSKCVDGRAIVTYCCPALYKRIELEAAWAAGVMIQRTNFAQPHLLVGHHSYTFTSPGSLGRAFSSPEDLTGKNLEAMRTEMRKKELSLLPASELILSVGLAIQEALSGTPSLAKSDRVEFVQNFAARARKESKAEYIGHTGKPGFKESLAYITALKHMFGTSMSMMTS